jgi:hypothetical protein
MNNLKSTLSVAAAMATIALTGRNGYSQGAFVNLNFESANVGGYAQNSSTVPITKALPGWGAPNSTDTNVLVWYDALSAGGFMIAVNDSNLQGTSPLQGNYSAWLFGGANAPATISQTGLVPIGTKSLQVDIQSFGYPFVVSLGGQTLSMDPLQTFPNYTLYGADISSLAGQTEQLSFTSPVPTGVPPDFLEIDNIQFSTSPIPEPGTCALILCGAAVFGASRWKRDASSKFKV